VVVMISSTIRDLPQHRGEVEEACLQQEMFPDMMEHLPASASDAIRVSLEKVNRADIYLGIFGHRYGHIPEGYDISITEMEYNRAVERRISRIIFIMHEEHQITISDVDFENRDKLDALKSRLLAENIVNSFRSPTDLRGLVVNSLAHYRHKRDEEKLKDAERLMQFVQEHGEISDLIKIGLKMVGPSDPSDHEKEGGARK
jgi:hypothetical protein